jgi:class 3 adenylate cyclase/uncharacterized protein HemY
MAGTINYTKSIKRVDNIIRNARELSRTDIKKSMALSRNALRISKLENYRQGVADAYRIMGNNFASQNKLPKALDAYELALTTYKEIGNHTGIAMIYNNLGIVNFKMSKFVEALEYYFLSLKQKEENKDYGGISSTLTNIGSVYQKQSNYTEAIHFYKKALSQAKKVKDNNLIAVNYQNLGETYIRQRQHKKALQVLEDSAKMLEKARDFVALVSVYINIGIVYKNQKKYADSYRMYELGIAIAKKEKLNLELAICYMNVAEIQLEQNDFENAEKNMLRLLSYIKNKSTNESFNLVNKHLSNLMFRKRDFKKAFQFQTKYIQGIELSFKHEKNTQISEIHMRYEVEKREKEAEIYKLKNIELKEALSKLDIEKKLSDKLLKNILPTEIAADLKAHGKSPVRYYTSVSVMFIDIKNFTIHTEKMRPDDLVNQLGVYFTKFEEIIERYKIEKIKTIGDAFLCACGLPKPVRNHAEKMILAAIEMRNFAQEQKKELGARAFEIRIGIHTGPVIAGIIGTKKFAYDIWGDTVNTAARMEQSSEPGQINLSESTYHSVKDKFQFIYRGKIPAKNKGDIDMYFVS